MDACRGDRAYRVEVANTGVVFDAPAGQPLLLAAEQAGVIVPSSCRNGTCRTCMALLRSGSVRHTIAWPGLLPEEKAEGWILPCVACAESDLVLEIA